MAMTLRWTFEDRGRALAEAERQEAADLSFDRRIVLEHELNCCKDGGQWEGFNAIAWALAKLGWQAHEDNSGYYRLVRMEG
jgi:hypothetical protein